MTEEHSATIWEHLTHKDKPIEEKLEDKITNVLKLHLGDFVIAKMLKNQTFEVKSVSEYSRHILGEDHNFSDYYVYDKEECYILRVVPTSSNMSLVWLKVYYEAGFEEDILDAAKCKIFNVDDDDGTHIEYKALNTEKEGFSTTEKIVTKDEGLKERELTYWDFYRDTEEGTELFFVEIDEKTGWITMLVGAEISINDIELIPK